MDPFVQSMLLTVILRETEKVESGLADELQQQVGLITDQKSSQS